jgi:hypothetical protein
MEQGYDTAVMQGVAVYMMLLLFIIVGGISFWFNYRFFGATLIVISAALLLWFVAGAPM